MSVLGRLVLTLIGFAVWAASSAASAVTQDEAQGLCPSQNVVIYFLPGETHLDSFDEALVDLFAERSFGCMIDQIEVDSFADLEDAEFVRRPVLAERATTVLGALSLRGVAANAVRVRLHQLNDQNPTGGSAAHGSRCEVHIRLRPHVGPMS